MKRMGYKTGAFTLFAMALSINLIARQTAPAVPPSAPLVPEINIEMFDKVADSAVRAGLKIANVELNKVKIKLKNLKVNPPQIDVEVFDELNNLPAVIQSNLFADRALSEKVRKISKVYSVDKNDKLSINNQFGKVVVNTWTKKEIKVDIEIRAFEDSDRALENMLNGVTIDEERANGNISLITKLDRPGADNRNGRNRQGVNIDYVIYMPERNPLEIVNKFGSITLPDLTGPVSITNSYGSVTAGELTHPSNSIEVKFGSATIAKFKSGRVSVSYGSLNVAEAELMRSDVRFGSTKIGRLVGGGNLENKYGSLKIDQADDIEKDLFIETDKGSVSMGVSATNNFDLNVDVHMGNFTYPNNKVNITSSTPDNDRRPQFDKNYKGSFGKGTGPNVKITSNYGSVRINSI